MKFSENWLRAFVDPPLTTDELAESLTMAGLEVEAVEPAAPTFAGVVVGEVLAVEKHPGADRLSVCRVDAGRGEPLTIVCGAPNVRAGMKAPCALVGAALPQLTIREASVRGVLSQGMLCSAVELGLAEESDGLLELAPDLPAGADLREALELDDHVLTLKLTPNRGDCLSVCGVAREVAAVTATSLRLPEVPAVEPAVRDAREVTVEAPDACPRYCGRLVRGIDPSAPTPAWMARRLERSGVRSIGAVVDITNYVMLEMGQPMHAFDAERIDGAVRVRLGRAGERLTLLNDQTVDAAGMLVIADSRGPLALAGIMGGAASAVGAGTADVFLESAFFAPAAVAGKAFALGFGSDSLHRFERGVDYAATRQAMERATQLLLGICGGQAGPITEAQSTLPKREPIELRVARATRVLGVPLDAAAVSGLLRRLHFGFVDQGGVFYVTPHSYRFDIQIEADLIEELARLHGYDRIPAARPAMELAMPALAEAERPTADLRRVLVARDYQEVVNYAFVDESLERDLLANPDPIRLVNPLASTMTVMRSSLAAGLLETLRLNVKRQQARVRLFEIGCCFSRRDGELRQPEHLGGLAYGSAAPEQWGSRPPRDVDLFDVKGDLEALVWPARLAAVRDAHPALHPGRSARLELDGQPVGWLGELHPRWQEALELPRPAVLFEIEVAALRRGAVPAAAPISRLPMVRRDIAVVVDDGVAAEDLRRALAGLDLARVVDIGLFDVYRGAGLPDGKKSLAFRVLLQDTEKTLTDQEVEAVMGDLVRVLERDFSAKLRV
jgi:phenylalanyl-tRNA synthetase beta chain